MRSSTRTLSLAGRAAAALLLTGMFGGCIMVPWPEHPDHGLDVNGPNDDLRSVVGSAKSDRLLRVGASTRQDAERRLGAPTAVTPDQRAYVYAQQMFSGYGLILPPLFPASGPLSQRTYLLRLNFDRAGTLRGHREAWGKSSDANLGFEVNWHDPVPNDLLTPN